MKVVEENYWSKNEEGVHSKVKSGYMDELSKCGGICFFIDKNNISNKTREAFSEIQKNYLEGSGY